jgi:opacity protein-like surface antigen
MFGLWFVSPGAIAVAQVSDDRKWEFEIHLGGSWPTNPARGTASLPAPGEVFTTATAMPTPAPSSRRESSWYFGDGAVLFNQAVVSLFSQAVGGPTTPRQIITLDPALGRPLAARNSAASVGMTLSRALTPRLGAELTVDYSRARLHITESNSDAIETTRASFGPAFEGMIRFNPNRVLTSVTSTASFESETGHQLVASAALVVNLKTSGNIIPYATLGAGLVSMSGETASATLTGNYQFRLPGGPPINETDTVTVRAVRANRSFAGIVGSGLKYHVSSNWGLRLGVRVALSKNTTKTALDAAPNVVLGLQPVGRGVLSGNPSLQFTNNSSDPVNALGVTAVAASTLTGPPIRGFRTFAGSGVGVHTNLVAGVFWRF